MTLLYIAAGFGVLVVVFFVWGLRLPKTQYAARDILIDAPVEEVWRVATDYLGQIKWRTDLHSVEIGHTVPGRENWVERPRRGAPVKLQVVRSRELELLEVEYSRDDCCSGRWIGTFAKAASATRLHVAETATTPGLLARMRVNLFSARDAAIETYQRDLKQYIEACHGAGPAAG